MLWVVLFPFGVLTIAIHDAMNPSYPTVSMGWTFYAIGVLLLLMVMGMAGAAGAGLAALIGNLFESHAVERARRRLVAIRDKDGVAGHFFLGSGFVNSDPYYFYYEQVKDGGFRPGKVRVGQGVRVYEEDRQDAELVEFEWDVDLKWAWAIAFPSNAGGYSYDFHVPRGTIRIGYTM